MWTIFLLLTSITTTVCQVEDSFESLTGELSEIWDGDRDKFGINSDKQLQLIDSAAGLAKLTAKFTYQDLLSWEAFLFLDFSPSNSNRLEFFLWSSDPDLESSEGMLIRMGESGSDDTIELIYQDGGKRETLAEGSLGLVGEGPVTLRLKASLDGDQLVMEADDMGGVCFLPEGMITLSDETLPTGEQLYVGWICRYTSTRSKSFFFDDIYVGSPRVDITSPSVRSELSTIDQIEVSFTEVMDELSLASASISISPTVAFSSQLTKDKLTLELSTPLSSSQSYDLSLSGLTDLANNAIDTSFIIEVSAPPSPGDLLLNEILFNPEGSGSDYVELINVSDKRLNLSGVILSNQAKAEEVRLEEVPPLAPGAFLLLTEDKQQVSNEYATSDVMAMQEINLPAFNNDDGNVSIQLDGVTLDSYDYDEDHHNRLLDDVDGVSLERISLQEANTSDNWTSAAGSAGFGTQ